MRHLHHTAHFRIIIRIHAVLLFIQNRRITVQKTQNSLFTIYSWNHRYTKIHTDSLNRCQKVSVLRNAFLGDIHIAYNFNTNDQRLMQIFSKLHIIHNHTVNTHTNHRFILKRFYVDITGIGIVASCQKTVKQLYNRCIILFGIVKLGIIKFKGYNVFICHICGLSGFDFRIVIINGAIDCSFLTQTYGDVHAGYQTNILDSVEIQRITCYHR